MSRPESRIQQAIVQFLRYKHIFCFSIPNGVMLGGKNKFAMLAMLKSEGFRLGSSDLVIVLKEKVLFVEIKTETGKQSDNQKEFQRDVEALGYEYLLWKSVDDCLKYFKT